MASVGRVICDVVRLGVGPMGTPRTMIRTYSFDPIDLVRDWVGAEVSDDEVGMALAHTHGTDEHRVKQAALELLVVERARATGADHARLSRKIRALEDELGVGGIATQGDPRLPLMVDEHVG
jgi:hypothetical protein